MYHYHTAKKIADLLSNWTMTIMQASSSNVVQIAMLEVFWCRVGKSPTSYTCRLVIIIENILFVVQPIASSHMT